jgi:hypothetical protein
MLKKILGNPFCKSTKIHPIASDPCESIYAKWKDPRAYDVYKKNILQSESITLDISDLRGKRPPIIDK